MCCSQHKRADKMECNNLHDEESPMSKADGITVTEGQDGGV